MTSRDDDTTTGIIAATELKIQTINWSVEDVHKLFPVLKKILLKFGLKQRASKITSNACLHYIY